MKSKTKRTIGWILLATLLLGVVFGVPYSAYLFGWGEASTPWYGTSFQILGILVGVGIVGGIVWGIVKLISSED